VTGSQQASTQPGLSRALSLGGAAGISTGLAFAAINFLGMAQLLAYISGPVSWIAVLGAGVLVLGVRGLFCELNGMYPSSAAIRLWMTRAMNDHVALIITLTCMTAIVLVIAADAFIVGEAIAYALNSGQAVAIGCVALLLGAATWLNLRGIKLTGSAERIVTSLVVVLTIAVGAVAILRHGGAAPATGGANSSPVQALVLGIFLYTGFEWVATNAEEVVEPRIIPRAMLVAVIVLAVSQTVFTVAMGLTLNAADRGAAYPQLLVARQALGQAGMLLMLGVTALTAVNTFSGGFVTLSRFVYAVAREGKLPRPLTRLNDRAVPVLPVWILGGSSLVLAVVVSVTGSFGLMVRLLGSYWWVSLIWLSKFPMCE
jgi:amino acid transporter